MSRSLNDALSGAAWSVSSIIYDLDDVLDDEGRPVAERRATAAVRATVEMDVRPCPYTDVRRDHLMNVSALTQISQYLDSILDEIAAFRAKTEGSDGDWSDILAAVMDQLVRPTIHLLNQRDTKGLVPAKAAVGHKLAAGFFGVMRNLHESLALGASMPMTTDALMDLIEQTGALLGASEACAGPPKLIRKACRTLIEGNETYDSILDDSRIAGAKHLALQVQLGIFWRLYDRIHLWALTRHGFREQLSCFNDYLTRRLNNAGAGLTVEAPQPPKGTGLPIGLKGDIRTALVAAVDNQATAENLEDDRRQALQLLDTGGSLIEFAGDRDVLARRAADYLYAYRTFSKAIEQLEMEIRSDYGFSPDAPIRPGSIVFPKPQAKQWYELVLGCRIDDEGRLTGNRKGLLRPLENA